LGVRSRVLEFWSFGLRDVREILKTLEKSQRHRHSEVLESPYKAQFKPAGGPDWAGLKWARLGWALGPAQHITMDTYIHK